MPLAPGTHLTHYEILSPIGAGGMGEVYRARDSLLDREVAIKVLPEHLARNAEALARFEREAKAVAALSHPNILAIHEFGADQGISFAVTELLEGETLRSRLTRAAFPWRKAVEMAAALADGLAAAHSKGIIHRDLKPENIFLTSDGRVKILDFGLVRFAAGLGEDGTVGINMPAETEAGMVLGTVGYMSPEQVRGETARAPSDIFALGCVLYEMVSGRRVFSRPTPAETMSAILRDDPVELGGTGKQIPLDLDRILSHCLEKNPEERFQSARDLAFALKAILSGSGPTPSATAAAPAGLGKVIDSIAVVPFANASRDPDAEYLSDGITETIINSLSQLPQLRVIPRSTMFRYKGRDPDPQAIGGELNVRAVLIGRVMQRGENLVVGTELVDALYGSQLWGERYNRKLSDILAVEEEIARKISESLRGKLAGDEKPARRSTESGEAYQHYLKGRYHWNLRSEDGFQKAIDSFKQAIVEDPAYALAYSGLADCYNVLCAYCMSPPREVMPRAKVAAIKALEIDDELAEAHTSLAFARWVYDWDWAGSEAEFKRAIELNPNYTTARDWYGLYLATLGRFDEAIGECRRALEIDPLSTLVNTYHGMILYLSRRYGEAIDQLGKALEMDPDYFLASMYLGIAYVQMQMYEEGIRALQHAARLNPAGSWGLGHAYGVSGNRAEAQRILNDLHELARTRYVAPFFFTLVLTGLGEYDRALDWLEKDYEDRSVWTVSLRAEPRLEELRSDPRFGDLLRKIGFPA